MAATTESHDPVALACAQDDQAVLDVGSLSYGGNYLKAEDVSSKVRVLVVGARVADIPPREGKPAQRKLALPQAGRICRPLASREIAQGL